MVHQYSLLIRGGDKNYDLLFFFNSSQKLGRKATIESGQAKRRKIKDFLSCILAKGKLFHL